MKRLLLMACTVCFAMALVAAPLFSAEGRNAGEQEFEVLPAAPESKKADYCAGCHRTLRGKDGIAVIEWEKSVHSRKNVPCNNCHGGNPDSMDQKEAKDKKYLYVGRPKKNEISEFCGRGGCHRLTINVWAMSPHYKSVKETGEPNCVSCHGSHSIKQPTVEILSEKSCAQCHPSELVKTIIQSIVIIDKDIKEIQKNIDYLRRKNAESGDLAAQLADARVLFHRIVHSLSSEDVQYRKKEMEITTSRLRTELEARVLIARRIELLYFVTAFMSFGLVIAFSVYTFRMYGKRKR